MGAACKYDGMDIHIGTLNAKVFRSPEMVRWKTQGSVDLSSSRLG